MINDFKGAYGAVCVSVHPGRVANLTNIIQSSNSVCHSPPDAMCRILAIKEKLVILQGYSHPLRKSGSASLKPILKRMPHNEQILKNEKTIENHH